MPEGGTIGEGNAFSLVGVEVAETSIFTYNHDDKAFGTPQTSEVGAATVDVDVTEIHAVDVDNGEMILAVIGLLPKDVLQ